MYEGMNIMNHVLGIAGNTVWGLHNCGVVWLPAVVERIYPAPPDGLG